MRVRSRQHYMNVAQPPSPNLASLEFLSGPSAGSVLPVGKPVLQIGREPGNDIVISDPSISRRHVQLSLVNGTWKIEKLAPQNTLTVNQQEAQQAFLKAGDIVCIGGRVTFRLGIPTAAPAAVGKAPYAASPQLPPMPPQTPPQASYQQAGYQAMPPQTPSQAGYQPTIQANGPMGPDSFKAGAPEIKGIPTLEVTNYTGQDRRVFQLAPEKQGFSIGRAPDNDIVIDRPTVSAYHAIIQRQGQSLVLVHPHPKTGRSSNGVEFQGHVVRGSESFQHALANGDTFRISDEHGTFTTLLFKDGSGNSSDAIPEIRPIQLGMPVITLGRVAENTVVLDHLQISKFHARLEQVQGGYRIVDLNSKNGLYVNGARISRGARNLAPNDEIRIGPFRFIYTGQMLIQQDESNTIRIDAINLVKEGQAHRILLNDISIAIPPRKFVALVGGSGAGKSTLMDSLNGLRPATKGTVLYNGQDYYHNLAAFSTQLGYVPQDDIIHRELTVEHALYYAARLRLPDDVTKEQIHQRIEEVLADVDLTARRHLLISKLSGGQRKRVSIALELLANPSAFFLDEPTSGLDPGLDRRMMTLMRRLADRGRTIVLVTHATNNINACDYVCFLAAGGHLTYFGPPDEAKAYFGKADFAEIYSALEPTDENPNIPAEAGARFRQSPDYQRYVAQPLAQNAAKSAQLMAQPATIKPPKRGNPWKQFQILSRRYLELLRNDVGNLAILLLQAPIIGLILFFMTQANVFNNTSIVTCPHQQNLLTGTGRMSYNCQDAYEQIDGPQGKLIISNIQSQNPQRYKDLQGDALKNKIKDDLVEQGSGGDAQKILFIMAFAAVMFGCINGAREIVKEAPIYRRERTVNLGIAPYMFSKIIVLGLLCLVQSLVLVAFVALKTPFKTSVILPPFLEIYITMCLTSLAGLMLGLMISALVPTNDRAMSMVPIALIPQVIFAGVIFSLDSPKALQIPAAFFPARWAMAAMGTTIGLRGDKLGADDFSYVSTLFGHATKGEATSHLLLTWFALLAMTLIFGLIIAFCLKRKDIRR
ncbi:FHA domain-containing protein [Ktedonobacter sp. SOSP1-52]|uniref:FHA domain-containing protein n=1 Tax=Ktedonobacter sp. SOSP1-52 TaxID=2778366 RepID=UPI001F445BAB|nr:FHA domain-containing protein [Ktedonobacter sp. SOSP1-52]